MDAWHDILDAATVQRIKTYSAFNDAESKNLMVQTAMEAGYELFKKETEKMGLVLQSDIDETIKQNFELKEELKKAYTMLDDFCRDSEIKSGEMMAKDYVKRNNLEYIESDILDAFHMGYITALSQMKDGKNQDYIIVKKKDLSLDWYKETKARLQEEEK